MFSQCCAIICKFISHESSHRIVSLTYEWLHFVFSISIAILPQKGKKCSIYIFLCWAVHLAKLFMTTVYTLAFAIPHMSGVLSIRLLYSSLVHSRSDGLLGPALLVLLYFRPSWLQIIPKWQCFLFCSSEGKKMKEKFLEKFEPIHPS